MTNIYSNDLPDRLKNIIDLPKKLYAYGKTEIMYRERIIGIVGSRYPSSEGRINAEKFAKELAGDDFVIVSGMAIGIDTSAHKGAINGKGKTIAVIGCGININYPKSNNGLKNELRENHLIISEYDYDIKPKGYHYPYRNRIISGISLGILVVEAKIKSGTMTTVNHALNQGKPVFVIPGSINNPMSDGNNYLIKLGAIPVTEAKDIIDYFNFSR
ncbi:MAG: DNA-processing protein DprA [Bacillota bacterium]|nr:DNA-processing protein DprA [Bacillota bacterium]